MLETVKKAIRVTTDKLDDEIVTIIEACKLDLLLSGVNRIDETDPLIKRAIIIYTKANFGSSVDSEKFQQSYNVLKCSLALASDYNLKFPKIYLP